MRAFARVLIGLIVACLTAALVKVLHVITPTDIWVGDAQAVWPRVARMMELVALTATQQAFFVVPLALIAAMVTEINRVRGPVIYATLGIAIAAAGFYLQYASESEIRTILNPYAARAYLFEGLLAGLTYWALAGRFAGWRRGGGLVKTIPYPIGKPRLRVSDVAEADGRSTDRAMKT